MGRQTGPTFLPRVLLIFSLAVGADATAQWDWKVTGYSNTFPSKDDAVDFMHGLSSAHDKLRNETLQSMSVTAVTYGFTAPLVGPNIGDWYYTTQHAPGQQLASEAAAIAAVQAVWAAAVPQCSAPTVTAEGSWSPTGWWYSHAQTEARTVRITNIYGWAANPSPHCFLTTTETTDTIGRGRSIGCPQDYSGTSTAPHCEITLVSSVYGPPLVCPDPGNPDVLEKGNEGNPCNVALGDKIQPETDYSGPTLTFKRTYHSRSLEPGAFGAGWTHNFARRLIDSSGFGLLRPDGFHEPFNTVSSNRWLSTTGSGIVVTKSGSQYTAHLSDGSREIYDASGKLTTLVSSAGLATTLTYSGGELTTVTGPFGHTLELSYSDGLISVLADPDGNETAYSYDAEGNLAEVLYPDATTRTGSPPISRTPMKRATMPEEVFDGKAKTIYAGVQARSCCTDGGSGRHDAASRGGARPQSARLEPLAVSAAGRG